METSTKTALHKVNWLPCFYSFPFNVISVATVLCFCGFHPPVVSTFPWFLACVVTLWFAPSCCLHLPMVTHGVHSVVCTFMVYTLLWFPPSCGLHLCMVPTLPVVTPWYPFRGLHHHVVYTLLWFPPSCGLHLYVVPTLSVVTPWCPFRSLHHHVVYTLPWFPLYRGLHLYVVPTLSVVTPWCPFRGLHHHVVYTLL